MARSGSLRQHRRTAPQLEGLEDRKLLYATLGANWAFGSRITYSFYPDGANIGGNPSNLYSSMANNGWSTSQWQLQFQKAAAIWESVANINLVQVGDDGSAFGVGNQQGDSRFGDIRIGGFALSSGTLATCLLPPPINGGSDAGDIILNTTSNYNVNNGYDVESVAIHEIGHALGLDHSALTSACMYAYYNGTKQSLTSDDAAGLQAVYGARQQDSFDASVSNQTYKAASNITPYLNASAQAVLPNLDVTGADIDFYVVTAPANTTGTLTVTMQSSGLSSLNPKISLFSGSLATIGITQAPANTFGGTVSVTTTGVTPGQTFYIRCQATTAGPMGSGAYGLIVNFGSGTVAPIAPPNTTVAAQADAGGGAANEMVSIGSLLLHGDNLNVGVIDHQHDRAVKPTPAASYANFLLVLADVLAPPVDSAGHVKKLDAKTVQQLLDNALATWEGN